MDYDKYRNKAKVKIAKYGADCVLTRATQRVYNEETNEYEDTTETVNGKAILSGYASAYEKETAINAFDVKLMAWLEDAPKLNDSVVFGDEKMVLTDFEEINPDGSGAIFYTLFCKK